jgi:hypothetical protein
MDLNEYYLDSSPSVKLLECIEIKHSLWPVSLRYVTNNAYGMTVKHEDGETAVYEYMPLQIRRGNTADNLDQTLSITVGDLGEVVPKLLKIIGDADSEERPQVTYRCYSSSNLDMPIDRQSGLEVEGMSRDPQATTFDAAAQRLNSVGTGRLYTVDEFPGLKGFF